MVARRPSEPEYRCPTEWRGFESRHSLHFKTTLSVDALMLLTH